MSHSFPSRNACLLISWLQSPSAVILEPKKICHCFHFFPIRLPWSDGTGCRDLRFFFFFWMLFKPAFSLSSFTLIKRLFSSSLLSAIVAVSSACLRLLILLASGLQLCFIQLMFCMVYSACELNKQGTEYSLVLLSQFSASLLFRVQFCCFCAVFSGGGSGGLVFLSLRIFHSLLWSTQSKASV